MLVVSRKKTEAILIDSVIRIEVVNMAKATVRVRLMAPRSLQLPHAVARKDSRERPESPARPAPVGMDVFHMTLVNQQVVALGESVSFGVVDADKTRVLFFVDAPVGTRVTAVDPERPDRASASSNQILLQFMGSGSERLEGNQEKSTPGAHPHNDEVPRKVTGPDLLPFPTNPPDKARL